MSKRKLIDLVENKLVDGWNDPRMNTLAGLRRRGYTPESIRLFAERIGISKADSWIDMTILEDCLREDLNERALRRIAVLDPVSLIIDNFPDGHEETCYAPNHPQKPELGTRELRLTKQLYIDREDFMEIPNKGFFRLAPGAEVRLRYAFIIKCTHVVKDDQGKILEIHCVYDPDTKVALPELKPARCAAIFTGCRPRMPRLLKSGCMTACSSTHTPIQKARISKFR